MNSSELPNQAQEGANLDETSHGQTMDFSGDATRSSEADVRNAASEWVGRRLGKYHITELLGVGGMGVVLKAHDTSIERDVAIKILPAELSADEVALKRFLAEAKSAGRLNHPNTITIYEVASEGATHYLVMEIVSGGSAGNHLDSDGPYSVSEACRIVSEACKGLSAAHRAGLIHRDIKPANLLLAEDRTVKVADFGLAKRPKDQSMMMTQAGKLVGTPHYMSPEQCEAREVDTRSDIYSLGATFYSLLTAKSPYEDSGSVVQVMFAHCNAGPPDPRKLRSDIPAACAQIIQRAMAKDPADRYSSMDDMRQDLEAVVAALSGTGILLPSRSTAGVMDAPARSRTHQQRSKWLVPAGIATALVVVAIAAFATLGRGPNNNEPTALDQGQQNSTASAVVAPLSDKPIKVGVLHSLTGSMGDSESPVVDATLLAIDQINQQGGVLGCLIEPVVTDGRSDSTTFAREAERLIVQEEVCTVFGCWTSASRKTVVPIFEEHDHLLVYPVQYEGVEESPNVIYTGAAPNQQIIPAVKWAYAFEGKRKFFLVGSDYVFPRVAHEIIKDQLEELGAEVVGEEFLPLGSSNVGPIVEKIEQTGPDIILNSINGDSNKTFFAKLRAAGIEPAQVPTMSFSIGEEELRYMDVSAMVGDYAAWNYFQTINSSENQEFISNFRQKYGPQRVVNDPMESAYFGVKLWVQAIRSAATTEPPEIRRAMRNQRTRAPGGEVRIDPATQHTFKTPRIGRLQPNGQFEIVWTAAKPQRPIPFPASRTSEEWRGFLSDLYANWGNRWSAPDK